MMGQNEIGEIVQAYLLISVGGLLPNPSKLK